MTGVISLKQAMKRDLSLAHSITAFNHALTYPTAFEYWQSNANPRHEEQMVIALIQDSASAAILPGAQEKFSLFSHITVFAGNRRCHQKTTT